MGLRATRAAIGLVALLAIATVAVGLRVGARGVERAATVWGAPPSHGHAAWQLHVQDEEGSLRAGVALGFRARVAARGEETVVDGVTNADGVAEVAFDRPGLTRGDAVQVTVVASDGRELAAGGVQWPAPDLHTLVNEQALVRPSRLEGPLRLQVAVLGGALAPGQPGQVWVTSPGVAGVDATADLGVEIASPFTRAGSPERCPGQGRLLVTAVGHTGGVLLEAHDDLAHTGTWYGALPIAAGAMLVGAPLGLPGPGPLQATITSASARQVAYVEVDDAEGRADAQIVRLTGDPPHADVVVQVRSSGRSFLVVSGDPDGAVTVGGPTRAFPLWAGPNAPCEAALAATTAHGFPRFLAVDGFALKQSRQAAKHRRGRLIALGGLLAGAFAEALLLLRALRQGSRMTTATAATKRTGLDILLVLALSLLGFLLLTAFVAWTV